MTSPRRFIPRPVPVEVMGPLTPDNAEEIAQWCGGEAWCNEEGEVRVSYRRGAPLYLGDYLLRHPDGSYTALTPEELDEGWVEEGVTPDTGVRWPKQLLADLSGAVEQARAEAQR